MSQDALAQRMRERGFKWSQATVWSVENGDRPLRLTEAIELSDIFGLSGIDELTTEDNMLRSEIALKTDVTKKSTDIKFDLVKLELSRQNIISYVNNEYDGKPLSSDAKERRADLLEALMMSRIDQLQDALKDGAGRKLLPDEYLTRALHMMEKRETLAEKIAYASLEEAKELCKKYIMPFCSTLSFFRKASDSGDEGGRD